MQPLAFVGPNPLSLVPNPRDIADLLKTITQVKPAFFNGVPTLYTAILNHPDVRGGKVDLSSIKLCFCGAAALMAETKRQFEEKTGARIIEGYSLTEGDDGVLRESGEGDERSSARSACRCPTSRCGSWMPTTGVREMASGDVGELIMRAPQLMTEYWNNPGRDSRSAATALRTARRGCTRETSPTSTRMATCFSWTGRRI